MSCNCSRYLIAIKQYDEEGRVTYNWGYDVQNHSAPETSFSTDPSNPKQTMKELKL